MVTRTSNIAHAGTDANVHVEIRGTRHKSGRIVLKNSSLNCFEKGQVRWNSFPCSSAAHPRCGWHVLDALG